MVSVATRSPVRHHDPRHGRPFAPRRRPILFLPRDLAYFYFPSPLRRRRVLRPDDVHRLPGLHGCADRRHRRRLRFQALFLPAGWPLTTGVPVWLTGNSFHHGPLVWRGVRPRRRGIGEARPQADRASHGPRPEDAPMSQVRREGRHVARKVLVVPVVPPPVDVGESARQSPWLVATRLDKRDCSRTHTPGIVSDLFHSSEDRLVNEALLSRRELIDSSRASWRRSWTWRLRGCLPRRAFAILVERAMISRTLNFRLVRLAGAFLLRGGAGKPPRRPDPRAPGTPATGSAILPRASRCNGTDPRSRSGSRPVRFRPRSPPSLPILARPSFREGVHLQGLPMMSRRFRRDRHASRIQ